MRSPKSRSRNRQNRQRSLGNVVNRVFDSSGPEGKVRGTPQQIIDKYLTLARDAQLSSDRVAEQSFLQHAEHYTRMLSDAQREMAERQQQQQQQQQGGQRGEGGDDDRRDSRRRDARDARDGRGDQRSEGRSDDADSSLPPARDTAEPAAEAEDLPGEGTTAADTAAQPNAEAEAEAKPKPKPRPRTRATTPRPRKPAESPAPDEVASGD